MKKLKSTRRMRFRKNLSTLYIPYYDNLCHRLHDRWQPYCGYRSIEEQNTLYAAGRIDLNLRIVTNARGGESAHNYGCASDWAYINDDGYLYWPEYQDEIWMEYITACNEIGLRVYDFERPHNELDISVSWTKVDEIRIIKDMSKAMKFIEEYHRR